MPERHPAQVPLSYSGKSTEVTCWEWSGSALDCGDSAAAWFTSYLGAPVRLVRFAPRAARSCEAAYAPEHGSRFSDGYPLLAISAASVAALNADLGRAGEPPLKMNRFRPNLVLGGTPAYAEARRGGLGPSFSMPSSLTLVSRTRPSGASSGWDSRCCGP